MKKLTPKEKATVKDFTDAKNKETFLNGTQSVLKNYNVKNPETAAVIASRMLRKDNVIQAIEKKIRSKEDDQTTLQEYVKKLDLQLQDGTITPENTALLRELREFIKLQGQFRGDFVEKRMVLTASVDRNADLASLSSSDLASELLKRLRDTPSTVGEGRDETA